MTIHISAMILLIATGAANAYPGGFAPRVTAPRQMAGSAMLAGDAPGIRCHGFVP
jgi:hypothetical protein